MTEKTRNGTIFTFYSYKGGVGRSMALANVAALMTKWGKKVLIVDWDLEAPGLEMFFKTKDSRLNGGRDEKPGVLDLITAFEKGKALDWHECLFEIKIFGKILSFISAGKSTHDYQTRVQHLDWEDLFERLHIGDYIDGLRKQWIAEYDFVLVDSRTGITDIGDICTVLLPDAIVLLFLSNQQNISGIKSAMERARQAHKSLPVNRSRLIGVPVPCRDEVYNEYEQSRKWKKIFAEELAECYRAWLPRGITPREVLNKLFIPYVANWSFGERLPVVENENEIDNPASISAAYSRLTRLLISGLDWNEIAAFSDPQEIDLARNDALTAKEEAARAKRKAIITSSITAVSLLITILVLGMYYLSFSESQKAERIQKAWKTIEATQNQRVEAGRIDALEFLNKNRKPLSGIAVGFTFLNGIDLDNAQLKNANFSGSDLSNASLRSAELQQAHLWMTNLKNADLSGANLNGANLSDANLSGANLYDADLTATKGLTINQIKSAKNWENAIFDENIKRQLQKP